MPVYRRRMGLNGRYLLNKKIKGIIGWSLPFGIDVYLESFFSNLSIGIAARVIIFMVPREPSSIETLEMLSLFAASTIFTKS